jgi:antitoxin YefM
MDHVSYSDLRQNLAHYMDQAVDSSAPILVTRQGGKGNVVILSEAEFASWEETVHLLRDPANAARLLRSIHSADAGDLKEHELVRRDPIESDD